MAEQRILSTWWRTPLLVGHLQVTHGRLSHLPFKTQLSSPANRFMVVEGSEGYDF